MAKKKDQSSTDETVEVVGEVVETPTPVEVKTLPTVVKEAVTINDKKVVRGKTTYFF